MEPQATGAFRDQNSTEFCTNFDVSRLAYCKGEGGSGLVLEQGWEPGSRLGTMVSLIRGTGYVWTLILNCDL